MTVAVRVLCPRSSPRAPASARQQPVTFDRILRANQEPQNWLTYSGNLSGHRYTLLTQITPANVKNLELQWVFQTRTPARAGREIRSDAAGRRRRHVYRARAEPCRGARCRDRPHVLDVLTAAVAARARVLRPRESRVWRSSATRCSWGRSTATSSRSTRRTASRSGTSRCRNPSSATPSRWRRSSIKDKVIIGPAGGEYGIRGFIAAFDAKTGKEVVALQHRARPGRARPRDVAGRQRRLAARRRIDLGDRLVRSRSEPDVLRHRAILVRTGMRIRGPATTSTPIRSSRSIPTPARLKWHYQFTPHDEFDYDATQVPVLADISGRAASAR